MPSRMTKLPRIIRRVLCINVCSNVPAKTVTVSIEGNVPRPNANMIAAANIGLAVLKAKLSAE